jgi:hypothetical protein
MKRIAAALLLAGFAATSASAQNVYGSGGAPCTEWTANVKRKWQNLNNVNWLTGYLSGVNRNRGPGAVLMPDNGPAGAEAFVAQYCAANPQKLIFEAADALIADMDARRGR